MEIKVILGYADVPELADLQWRWMAGKLRKYESRIGTIDRWSDFHELHFTFANDRVGVLTLPPPVGNRCRPFAPS